MTVAFLALAFCAVLCAGAAQTLDVLLAKQVDETNAESSISDLSLLSALHTPWLAISISAARPLWLVAPSNDYLPLGHTSSPNYVRPPPFTS
jgi:hypothetical protein